MDYKESLELAGAKVLAYESFGSYQGDWIAKVIYNGKTGWIKDYFGSCSGCDAFEAEFSDVYHDCLNEDYYSPLYNGFRDGCETCQSIKNRVIKFGESYLENMISYDDVLKDVSKNEEWDMDASDMIKFVKDNG